MQKWLTTFALDLLRNMKNRTHDAEIEQNEESATGHKKKNSGLLQFGSCFFVVLAIISIGCHNILLTKATAVIWENGDIGRTKEKNDQTGK